MSIIDKANNLSNIEKAERGITLPDTLSIYDIVSLWTTKQRDRDIYCGIMYQAFKHGELKGKEEPRDNTAFLIYGKNTPYYYFKINRSDFKAWLKFEGEVLPKDCLLLKWWPEDQVRQNPFRFPDQPIWTNDDSTHSIYSKNGNGDSAARDWDRFESLTINEVIALSLGLNPLRMEELFCDKSSFGTLQVELYNIQVQVIYTATRTGKIRTVKSNEDITGNTLVFASDAKDYLADQESFKPNKPENRVTDSNNMDIEKDSNYTPEELIQLNKPLPNILKSRHIARLWQPASIELYIKLMYNAINHGDLKIQANGKRYKLVRHADGDTSVFAKWIYARGDENGWGNQFDVEIDRDNFKQWLDSEGLTLPSECLLLHWLGTDKIKSTAKKNGYTDRDNDFILWLDRDKPDIYNMKKKDIHSALIARDSRLWTSGFDGWWRQQPFLKGQSGTLSKVKLVNLHC